MALSWASKAVACRPGSAMRNGAHFGAAFLGPFLAREGSGWDSFPPVPSCAWPSLVSPPRIVPKSSVKEVANP